MSSGLVAVQTKSANSESLCARTLVKLDQMTRNDPAASRSCKGSTINDLGGGAEKISDANFFFIAEAFFLIFLGKVLEVRVGPLHSNPHWIFIANVLTYWPRIDFKLDL